MQLRELTRQRRLAIRSEDGNEIGNHRLDAVHGLVKHHRARFPPQRFEVLATRDRAPRQETLECEAFGRNAAY